MKTRITSSYSKPIKPSYEFDGRIFLKGRASPLLNVKLWLPLDCHEDANISVTGPGSVDFPPNHGLYDPGGQTRLISEIDATWGLTIEATNISIGSVNVAQGMTTGGANFHLNHIGRLRICQRLNHERSSDAHEELLTSVSFLLSALDYGKPFSTPHVDYHGNRKSNVSGARALKMRLGEHEITLELYRHWNWQRVEYGREVAASCPAFQVKDAEKLSSAHIESIHRMGEDACVLLTLAARHLTVVHVVTATTRAYIEHEWLNPLNRLRSTTEEGGTGSLIPDAQLELYFDAVSRTWVNLTTPQQDAVRRAVFAVHPFSRSSLQGRYLQMFAALEGLARVWFPGLHKLQKKMEALTTALRPYSFGLWPITGPDKTGLDAVRNHIGHGYSMDEPQLEALLAATDHLHIWIERILLMILSFEIKEVPQDWLSRHVEAQRDELPSFQGVW